MLLRISTNSGVPIYQQILNQVKFQVASGRLQPGDELPAIRALADQLLVNPNTVARAYRELETAGLVVSKVGSGTVVAEGLSPLARKERVRLLTEEIDSLVAHARHLGFTLEDVLALVRQRDAEFGAEREGESSHE